MTVRIATSIKLFIDYTVTLRKISKLKVAPKKFARAGHPDYPGHLGHFLSGSKWVSPGHVYMPDPDQNCLVIMCIN